MKEYHYLGDRHTDPKFRGATCTAVLRPDGKCYRGKNGSMLVAFPGIGPVIVVARLLRKLPTRQEREQFISEYFQHPDHETIS